MISDEERREVAAELRKLDVSDLGGERNIIDTPEESGVLFDRMLDAANDYRAGLHYFPSHFKARDAVELFADLIDRPTCRNLSSKPADVLLCSECGEHVDIAYVESCDDYHAKYCPNCGAEVVPHAERRD